MRNLKFSQVVVVAPWINEQKKGGKRYDFIHVFVSQRETWRFHLKSQWCNSLGMRKHTAEQLNQPQSDSWELERARQYHYFNKHDSNTGSKNLLGRVGFLLQKRQTPTTYWVFRNTAFKYICAPNNQPALTYTLSCNKDYNFLWHYDSSAFLPYYLLQYTFKLQDFNMQLLYCEVYCNSSLFLRKNIKTN